MVQNYIQFPQNQNQFRVLRPNIKKIHLKNLSTITGIVFLISVILLMLHLSVGLDIFLLVFEAFDITINPSMVLLSAVVGILTISALLMLGNYLAARNLRYELYQDKLIIYRNALLVFVNSKEVPYQNIVKISYNNNGIFNSLFNSGTIVLELTGMGENKVELQFVDNIQQTTQYIQNLIREYMNIQQAQFTENYKIDNILNRM